MKTSIFTRSFTLSITAMAAVLICTHLCQSASTAAPANQKLKSIDPSTAKVDTSASDASNDGGSTNSGSTDSNNQASGNANGASVVNQQSPRYQPYGGPPGYTPQNAGNQTPSGYGSSTGGMNVNPNLQQLVPEFNKPLPQVPPSMANPMQHGPGFGSGWAPAPPQAQQQASADEQRVAQLERIAFGSTYPEHEVDDRLEHLEREVFSKTSNGDVESRLARLEAKLGGASAFSHTPANNPNPNPQMRAPAPMTANNNGYPQAPLAMAQQAQQQPRSQQAPAYTPRSYSAPPARPAYGAPQGMPAYGAPPVAPVYGAQQSAPPYGAPQYGTAQGSTPYGAPQASSAYGAPASGGAQGSSAYGAPPYAAPQGSSAYSAPPYAAPQGSSAYGAPAYGAAQGSSGYAAPPYGTAQGSSAYAAPPYGAAQGSSAYAAPPYSAAQGSSAYGAPPYGAAQGSSAYGAPQYGAAPAMQGLPPQRGPIFMGQLAPPQTASASMPPSYAPPPPYNGPYGQSAAPPPYGQNPGSADFPGKMPPLIQQPHPQPSQTRNQPAKQGKSGRTGSKAVPAVSPVSQAAPRDPDHMDRATSDFQIAVQSIPYDKKAGDYLSALQHFPAGTYAHWTNFPVRVHVPVNAPEAWKQALDASVHKWDHVVPIMTTPEQEPADIEVAWIDHLPPRQLGITNLEIFNGRMRVTVYLLRPTYYPPDVPEKALQQIATHELGHALGIFGHSSNAGDVMVSLEERQSNKGKFMGTAAISARDINTLRKLYESAPLSPDFQSPQPISWP